MLMEFTPFKGYFTTPQLNKAELYIKTYHKLFVDLLELQFYALKNVMKKIFVITHHCLLISMIDNSAMRLY